ncbi:DNA repair protein RecO [Cucumibacter marinus]|uniref:DNA repair protein RecO n=1 Tax=Cucumibacter marinus TaxID=1121252 RepID=UPI0003F9B430|nr:DNA repair protein RecO [Cucumibacter marinus]
MQWSSEGLIIGTRRHGENAMILEVMTPDRGRHLGLVRGGRSRRYAAVLQPGNSVLITWRARLDEHLGTYQVEAKTLRAAALMESRRRLYLSQLLCEHLRLLPERDPHERLYLEALAMLDNEADPLTLGRALARFELRLLDDLGFGLDLTSCAATGVTHDLRFVSPRSARAVSAEAGKPYADRLLPLPAFLTGAGDAEPGDLAEAFRLTGHFLAVHIWQARDISPPATRDHLISRLVEPV